MDIATVVLLLASGACVLGACFEVYRARAARTRRRQRLSQREALPEEEWLNRYMPADLEHREDLAEVLEALGRHVGVPWTSLRPDDSFDGSLGVEGTPFASEELLEFECFMEDWLEKKGISPREVHEMDDVDSFIKCLNRILAEKESKRAQR